MLLNIYGLYVKADRITPLLAHHLQFPFCRLLHLVSVIFAVLCCGGTCLAIDTCPGWWYVPKEFLVSDQSGIKLISKPKPQGLKVKKSTRWQTSETEQKMKMEAEDNVQEEEEEMKMKKMIQ